MVESKESKPETSKAKPETSKEASKKETSPEDDEKDILSKNPNLYLAELRFFVNHAELDPKVKAEKWKELIELIKENEMGPFYELICQELDTQIDAKLLADLKAKNEKRIAEVEAEIKDAEENLGESEVRQAWLRKSEYLCQIGDKDAAVSAFRQTYEKTVGMGHRIDLIFNLIRLGLFFMDHQLINANLSKAKELMEQGGDWERKNRLRSYEGLYKMAVRDFKAASALFLEAVPTFGSYELISYEQLVFYTVIACMLALDRPDLRSKVIQCNEVQEQLVGGGSKGELVLVKQYLDSLYECQYDQFFHCLARIESERLKFDRYLEPHYSFYARAMRLKAYDQFLTPYKTPACRAQQFKVHFPQLNVSKTVAVRLGMMARDFGVSPAFIDKELHSFIGTGLLHCRIDAVRGVIEMNHPDSKNDLYKAVIRDGDILLNRIQKLARVINE